MHWEYSSPAEATRKLIMGNLPLCMSYAHKQKKFQSNFQSSVWAFIIVYRYNAANLTKDYSLRSILGLHLPHPISCGALCQINCDTKTRDVNLCDVGSTLYTELGNILCFWAIPNRHERTLWLFKVLINKKPIKKKAWSAQKEETIHFFMDSSSYYNNDGVRLYNMNIFVIYMLIQVWKPLKILLQLGYYDCLGRALNINAHKTRK